MVGMRLSYSLGSLLTIEQVLECSKDSVKYGYTTYSKKFFPGKKPRNEQPVFLDIKRASKGKSNTEEDIAIEEIVERENKDTKEPRIVPVVHHKEAV